MNDRLFRAFRPDLEIRTAGDGRTVHGIAAPFDRPAQIAEGGLRFAETIRRGAFTKTLQGRTRQIKFLSQHRRDDNPLGVFTELREDAAGLYVEARVSETRAGDDVLALVRDGALDGWSIGFGVIRERWNNDRSQRDLLELRLAEVSLVTFPAYDDARVVGVRADGSPLTHPIEPLRQRVELLRKAIP